MKFVFSLITIFLLASCSNLKPVTPFDAERYYGTWYEITKRDYKFERECKQARLIYTPSHSFGVDVLNECFDANGKKIKDATAKAYIKKDNVGEFAVYMFSLIYLEYRVIYIDENYEYAIVDGGNYNYFWIISKFKHPNPKKIEELIAKAKELGFNTSDLIINKY